MLIRRAADNILERKAIEPDVIGEVPEQRVIELGGVIEPEVIDEIPEPETVSCIRKTFALTSRPSRCAVRFNKC